MKPDAIAVVGLGCRFPRAPDVDAYWRNICDARVCFSDILRPQAAAGPAARWNHQLFYDPSPRATDKTYARKVGLLDDLQSFAALHYAMAPLRAQVMDPQHRLLLDTVRVALEDAGYGETMLGGSRTGVFVGASVSEYKDLITSRLRVRSMLDGQWGRALPASPEIADALIEDVTPLRAFSIAGNLLNMAAATVAQTFDLRGPAFTIDAACSSSLVAAADAVLSLRARVCDVAIAGGTYLNLTPDNLVGFSRIGAISPSDACRPFDEKSDGFVLGEGVGAVVLKRLDDALRDRDRIYCVIRGAGINNDGRGEGPMTPRLEGQLDAITRAYEEVDFTPESVGFVEAHGTATAVGDATELGALRRYSSEHAKGPVDAVISSVKANIGHTMSAAGVAGLIKASLVIESGQIPPQAAFNKVHGNIGLEGSGFRVATEPQKFAGSGPRRGGVSSFGFGGTNCHLVIEQGPATRRPMVAVLAQPRPEPFFVSAPTPDLLDAHLGALASAIKNDVSLADLSYTLATRQRYEARVAFTAHSHDELRAKLEAARAAVRAGASQNGVYYAAKPLADGDRKIAMMFPGQGAQTLGLCKALYDRFPTFRARLDELASDLDDLLEKPLLSYLYPHRNGAPFDEAAAMRALTATEVCQPAMAALGLAMFELAESLGIVPSAFIGHSLGEFVALAAGGVLSSRDMVRFVAKRGRIMANVELADRGAMSAVQGERTFVESHLQGSDVVVANINHPKQTVISGPTDAVLAAGARLAAAGASVTRLTVSHAFHSPLLAVTDVPLAEVVSTLDVHKPARTVISCVDPRSESGEGPDRNPADHGPGPYADEPDRIRETMAAHATSTINFVDGVRALAKAGTTIFVQAAAGTTLLAMARATLRADGAPMLASTALAGTTDDDGTPFIEALAELAVLGVPVALRAVHDGEATMVPLPATPLPTEKYWCVTKSGAPKQPLPSVSASAGGASMSVAAMPAMPGAPTTSDGLVALFKQQMDVLQAHAEIMRHQAAMLGGAGHTAQLPTPSLVAPAVAPAAMPQPAPQMAASPQAVASHAAPQSLQAAPPAPVAAPGDDDVAAKLFDIVATVSAFPRAELKPTQRLVTDLGFDSLMIVELAGKASDTFPGLKGLPKTLFAGETTIADVIDHVRGVVGKAARRGDAGAGMSAGSTAQADAGAQSGMQGATSVQVAPVTRYVPTTVERPVAPMPQDAIAPFGGRIAIVADKHGVAVALHRLLQAAGVNATIDVPQGGNGAAFKTAAGVIDLRPLDVAPSAVVMSGDASPNGSRKGSLLDCDVASLRSSLVATLPLAQTLARGGHASLFAIAYSGEHDEDLAGFAKALAREWPDARVKAMRVDTHESADEIADAIFAELMSPDATVEVKLDDANRQVSGLEAMPITERVALREGVVVAISGGARGLGAKIAVELATHYRAKLVLLGRSRDHAVDALIASIARTGGEAMFASCDVRDPVAVANAIDDGRRQYGPIEVIVHAAGVIADCAVANKDIEKFTAVFDTKVGGWLALERATRNDPLRVALALTSWSGRFGNAEQTDYAAANHLVASLAAAWHRARPSTRVVALDLPPWDGSAMASTIPAGMRAVMRARGVHFLDDASGLAAVLAELEATDNATEVLLGHDVGIEHEDHVRVRIALDTHPYLADHKINGVPVLPLAAAADYVAAAGARLVAASDQSASVVVTDLELIDGVRLVDGPVELDIRTRGRGPFEVELAPTSAPTKLAYRARVAAAAGASAGTLSELATPAALQPASLSIADFYAKHTFHGPRMRGIESIAGLDDTCIKGVVRSARAGELGDKLAAFALDPLVVDASFQLAAYFVLVKHRRAGLPLGFDELRVLAPIQPGARITCLVRFQAQQGDLFVGDIDYRDPLGRLVAQLRGVRGAFKPIADVATAPATSAPTPSAPSVDVPRASYTIEEFPEYLALRARIDEVNDSGIENPYFNVHERVTADTAVIKGREVINFSTYNYLGLSGDPAVSRAAIEAITKFGTSVSASRIASGEKPLHRELEISIAKFLGCEDSIVMVGGHATNVSVIGHVVGPGDLVMHDSLAHDSILGGIKLSGARRRPFPHNDWQALDEALRQVRGSFRRVLIAIEGVYSMDGDIPDLARFIEVKKRHKAIMLVDEAHSLGVLGARGAGIGELFDVDRKDVELWMGTLSKSLASCGGYIAGSAKMVEFLKYTNPGFVYSVGISPANAAAAIASLRELQKRPKLVATLAANSKLFLELCKARGIDTGLSAGSAVVPCIIGDSVRCMLVANALAEAGINVQPIVYPAVEEHLARLRFFISARHTEAQLRSTVDTLATVHATFNRTRVKTKPAPTTDVTSPLD